LFLEYFNLNSQTSRESSHAGLTQCRETLSVIKTRVLLLSIILHTIPLYTKPFVTDPNRLYKAVFKEIRATGFKRCFISLQSVDK